MHRVKFEPRAQREIDRLPPAVRERALRAIEALSENPRPPACKKVKLASRPAFRIRIGDYRVIYEVQDRVLIVIIIHVVRRNERSYRDV